MGISKKVLLARATGEWPDDPEEKSAWIHFEKANDGSAGNTGDAIMNRNSVIDPTSALAYLTDCTLATVEHLATLKSRKKSEYARHTEIAQVSVDYCEQFGIDISQTRAQKVRDDFSNNVKKWAEHIEQRATK